MAQSGSHDPKQREVRHMSKDPRLHSCIVCSVGSMEDLGALVALKVLSAAGSRRLCVTPHYRLAAVSSLARTRLGPTSSATNNPKWLSGCSLHCLGYNKWLGAALDGKFGEI